MSWGACLSRDHVPCGQLVGRKEMRSRMLNHRDACVGTVLYLHSYVLLAHCVGCLTLGRRCLDQPALAVSPCRLLVGVGGRRRYGGPGLQVNGHVTFLLLVAGKGVVYFDAASGRILSWPFGLVCSVLADLFLPIGIGPLECPFFVGSYSTITEDNAIFPLVESFVHCSYHCWQFASILYRPT
jgi:hypothetical protein